MSRSATSPSVGRRTRNSLSPEVILDAAEAVAETGFDALTIRAVAAELDSSAMALYRHFANKNELIDALLDRVLGRMGPVPATASPLADLATFARHHRALLRAHPWAVAALIARPLPGPNAIPIGEAALAILDRAGISGDRAVASFSGILALNYGWTSFEQAKGNAEAAPTLARIAAGPEPRFPLTAALTEPMSRYGANEHYEFVITALVAGIAGSAP
jgi:AcrR family transcriptional regulator